MKKNNALWRIRNRLANDAMEKLWNETSKLIEQFGCDGAEDYLQVQLQFVRDVRNIDEMAGSDNGDEF